MVTSSAVVGSSAIRSSGLHAMGLRYPDDIALLGYALEDDVLSATSRLSVISYPLEEMCNTALSLLMARIAGEPNLPEPPVMKQIPASLIIRDSTILRL